MFLHLMNAWQLKKQIHVFNNTQCFPYLNNSLVIAGPPEEGFAALAGEGAEMKPCSWFVTNPALLVLQRVDRTQLKIELKTH
jgi:hypothetical protein